jgi:hypothetical protein
MALTSRESRVNMFWNQQVQTDRTIPNNKLDIIVRDNGEKRTCLLRDIAISGDRNVMSKEVEKVLNYRTLH